MCDLEKIAVQCCGEYIQKIALALVEGHPQIVDLYTELYFSSLQRVSDHKIRKQIESTFAKLYAGK